MSGELSQCCGARAKVSCGDEGTCCYICEKCGKPCDLSSWEGNEKDKELHDRYFAISCRKSWLKEQIKACDIEMDDIKKEFEK